MAEKLSKDIRIRLSATSKQLNHIAFKLMGGGVRYQ